MAGIKRRASTPGTQESEPETPKRRQSGRARKVEIKYEESHSQDEAEDSEAEDEFQEEENSDSDEDVEEGVTSEEEEFASDESEDEVDKKKSKKSASSGGTVRGEYKAGQDSYSVDIPQEKPDGGVAYEAHKIHQNTLDFLKDLKKNNEREWLKCKSHPLSTL